MRSGGFIKEAALIGGEEGRANRLNFFKSGSPLSSLIRTIVLIGLGLMCEQKDRYCINQ